MARKPKPTRYPEIFADEVDEESVAYRIYQEIWDGHFIPANAGLREDDPSVVEIKECEFLFADLGYVTDFNTSVEVLRLMVECPGHWKIIVRVQLNLKPYAHYHAEIETIEGDLNSARMYIESLFDYEDVPEDED